MAANRADGGLASGGYRSANLKFIHGARSVVRAAKDKTDAHRRWINDLVKRRNQNVAAVALANQNARMAWVRLTRPVDYRAPSAA